MDLGFDRIQLAGMITMLDRYVDDDLPLPAEQALALRDYFRDWRRALTASADSSGEGAPTGPAPGS